jgi:hypothetical protein
MLKGFIVDYIKRHAHPLNAVLHIFGVPAVVLGIYFLITKQFAFGIVLIVVGYFLQYLGHRAQGNEVGEVTLIKNIVRAVRKQAGGNV